MLANLPTKSSVVIQKLLASARLNGARVGMAEERMFVKEVVCGKAFLFKKIDIKGRGRMGIIKVPKCHVKLTLEEKPLEEFYKMVLKGDTPPAFGTMIKTMLYQSGADFEKVASLSHMTNSKGRHYRRTQFKRLIQHIQKVYRSKGQKFRRDKIERNVLDKLTARWSERVRQEMMQMELEEKNERQQLFN